MSIEVMTLVFYADPARLTSTEKLVLLAMADHGNDEGRHVYPSVRKLALKTSLSERGVQNVLSKLRSEGILAIVTESNGSRANEYEIDVEMLFSICVDSRTKERVNVVHPPTKKGVNVVHPPESGAPLPPHDVHPRGESGAPKSLINHHLNPDEENSSPPMDRTPQSIWDFISGQIAVSSSRGFYTSWIEPASPISLVDGLLKIGVANQHAQELLQSRIGPTCNRIIRGLVNFPGARVEFVIREPAVMKAGAR